MKQKRKLNWIKFCSSFHTFYSRGWRVRPYLSELGCYEINRNALLFYFLDFVLFIRIVILCWSFELLLYMRKRLERTEAAIKINNRQFRDALQHWAQYVKLRYTKQKRNTTGNKTKQCWYQVDSKGNQFLFLIRHPSSYSKIQESLVRNKGKPKYT